MIENIIAEIIQYVPYYIIKGATLNYFFTAVVGPIFPTLPAASFFISWFVCDEIFFDIVLPELTDMSVFPVPAAKAIASTYEALLSNLGSHDGVYIHVTKTMELFYNRSFDVNYVKEAVTSGTRINKYPDVLVVFRLIGENMVDDPNSIYSYVSYMVDNSGKRVKGGLGPNNPFQYASRRPFQLPNSEVDYKYMPAEINFKHACFLGGSIFALGLGICLFNPSLITTAIEIGSNTINFISTKF